MNINDYAKGTLNGKPLIVQCCVCRKIQHQSNGWEAIPIPPNIEISHTYCEICGEEVLNKIKERSVLLTTGVLKNASNLF